MDCAALFAKGFIGLSALFHFAFMIVEMFFWTRNWAAPRILKISVNDAVTCYPLAKNQGLYNGFLAVGMVYMLIGGVGSHEIGLYCLGCAVVAGLYGAWTIGPGPLLFQTLPASLALALTFLARNGAS